MHRLARLDRLVVQVHVEKTAVLAWRHAEHGNDQPRPQAVEVFVGHAALLQRQAGIVIQVDADNVLQRFVLRQEHGLAHGQHAFPGNGNFNHQL